MKTIENNANFKEHFNPYRNEKCLEWYLDNNEDFKESLIKQEIENTIEHYFDNLCDQFAYYGTPDNKALNWASENYDDLDFSFEYNPSWYCDNDKLGTWQNFNPCRWAQGDEGHGGIFVTTLQGPQEIELQCDNGELVYISCDGYFKVLAALN